MKEKSIVIIDDNVSFVDVLKRFLHVKTFKVFVAYNGTDGLSVIDKVMPNVVLLDVMMHGLSGYEVCEKIKKNEKVKHIPVIFLTVRSRPEDIEKGFKLGAAHYITKPFNYPELMEVIKKVMVNYYNCGENK